MIQRIGEMLPSYEEYFNLFVRRKQALEEDTGSTLTFDLRHHRLQKALSFVYADIVKFCQDACRLFGSNAEVRVFLILATWPYAHGLQERDISPR
jgi:hypothetical protein